MSEGSAPQAMDFWRDADSTDALERYRTLVGLVDDGIYRLDAAGRFVAVHVRTFELTARTADGGPGSVDHIRKDEDAVRRERFEQWRTAATDDAMASGSG